MSEMTAILAMTNKISLRASRRNDGFGGSTETDTGLAGSVVDMTMLRAPSCTFRASIRNRREVVVRSLDAAADGRVGGNAAVLARHFRISDFTGVCLFNWADPLFDPDVRSADQAERVAREVFRVAVG